MAQILFPLFDSTAPTAPHDHILFAPIDNPRATTPRRSPRRRPRPRHPRPGRPDLAAALAQARALTPPGGLIVATGSIYLVGDIRRLAGQG